MNINPWLLPGAALLVTGGWIATEKRSSATLEREITVLSERIARARSAGGDDVAAGREKNPLKSDDGVIDWKNIAGKFAQARGNGGPGDMQAHMRLQRLLLDMSAEELGTQLDEIEALDLEDPVRMQLRGAIMGVLASKDPKMVLEKFSGEMNDEQSGARWHLQGALGKWAETEPVAAAAWLDAQIAAGAFASKSLDGKNDVLLRMEHSLVRQLITTNPAAATARVAALPEDQREDFFRQGSFAQVGKEADGAMAKLVRDSLPAEKVAAVIADQAGSLAMMGGYERVDGFIASANATDEEKSLIVSKVMEGRMNRMGGDTIQVEELDKARAWGATQAPAAVEKATGEVLAGTLWRGGKFKDASALALQYHEQSGNDEVLAAFLKSTQVRNGSAADAGPLIEKIHDSALREEIRSLPEYAPKSPEP